MSDCATFLLPVIILTPDSDLATPISYKGVEILAIREQFWVIFGEF